MRPVAGPGTRLSFSLALARFLKYFVMCILRSALLRRWRRFRIIAEKAAAHVGSVVKGSYKTAVTISAQRSLAPRPRAALIIFDLKLLAMPRSGSVHPVPYVILGMAAAAQSSS